MGSVDYAASSNSAFILAAKKPKVFFVLGGAGGGKSTQCAHIAKQMGYTHLSSGDLLRAEAEKPTDEGAMIRTMLKDGVILTSDIMLKVLLKAMLESGNDKFLLDGFPRSEENRAAFEQFTQIEPELVLVFECSEEERLKRIRSRQQGRMDDNDESIKKRFTAFRETTVPVIQYYESKGKVRVIDAERPKEEVLEKMKAILMREEAPSKNLLTSLSLWRQNCCAIL